MRCHCRPSAAALAQCCSLINLDVPNPSFPTGMTIVTTVTGPGWSPPNILMLWHDHRPDAPCFIPGKRCKEPLAAPCIRNPYLAPPTPPSHSTSRSLGVQAHPPRCSRYRPPPWRHHSHAYHIRHSTVSRHYALRTHHARAFVPARPQTYHRQLRRCIRGPFPLFPSRIRVHGRT